MRTRLLMTALASAMLLLLGGEPAHADLADQRDAEAGRGNGFGGHLGADRRSENRRSENRGRSAWNLIGTKGLKGNFPQFGPQGVNKGGKDTRSVGVGDKIGNSAQMRDKATR